MFFQFDYIVALALWTSFYDLQLDEMLKCITLRYHFYLDSLHLIINSITITAL